MSDGAVQNYFSFLAVQQRPSSKINGLKKICIVYGNEHNYNDSCNVPSDNAYINSTETSENARTADKFVVRNEYAFSHSLFILINVVHCTPSLPVNAFFEPTCFNKNVCRAITVLVPSDGADPHSPTDSSTLAHRITPQFTQACRSTRRPDSPGREKCPGWFDSPSWSRTLSQCPRQQMSSVQKKPELSARKWWEMVATM